MKKNNDRKLLAPCPRHPTRIKEFSKQDEMNVLTPLFDIAFILLIFVMVFVEIKKKSDSLQIKLPSVGHTEYSQKGRVNIYISKNNKITVFYKGKKYGIRDAITAGFLRHNRVSVYADSASRFNGFAEVISILKKEGSPSLDIHVMKK